MAFGNGFGVKLEHSLDPRDAFAPAFGDLVAEVPADQVGSLSIAYTVIGEVSAADFVANTFSSVFIHASFASPSSSFSLPYANEMCIRDSHCDDISAVKLSLSHLDQKRIQM